MKITPTEVLFFYNYLILNYFYVCTLSNMYILPIYKLSLGLYMHYQYPPHSSPIQSIAKINYLFAPHLIRVISTLPYINFTHLIFNKLYTIHYVTIQHGYLISFYNKETIMAFILLRFTHHVKKNIKKVVKCNIFICLNASI